ncbi:peritrophin-44-like [Anopheles nili]|uniref:peritrophin-44-like n=1 Tax=Anopheles nili TaxID=185578 RepID=UPI00237B14C2|nr:peritrophin-44-like [Anopheles nili]
MQSNSIIRFAGFMALLFSAAFGVVTSNDDPCRGVQNGYFVRDKNDCKGYYYCTNEGAIRNVCPDEFYFNELAQTCDYPEKVNCHICQQQAGVQVSAHPQHCNQFIMCSEGYSSVGQCAEGYLFDALQHVCNPSRRVNCTANRCPEQDNPNQIVYLPGVDSCEEYFICQSGMAVQKFCAPGLYWDSINERCDFSQNISCTL